MNRSGTVFVLFLILTAASGAYGQLRIIRTERLPLDTAHEWACPVFSPDGKSIYFTTAANDGIYEYSTATRTTRMITVDQGAGFGFSISPDGAQIAYRRSSHDPRTHERTQQIVIASLAANMSTVVATGPDLSIPMFSQGRVVYSAGTKTKNLPSVAAVGEVGILGIEKTKIAVNVGGRKLLLDPLKNGSYIWPSLSPDRTRILAYEMDGGAFICDLSGNILSRLGRCNAPVWTRDGKWVVYMNDRDDGHTLLTSDLFCISPGGGEPVRLTADDAVDEMYPSCSSIENKIACSSASGDIYLFEYEETAK
ncbi:MAG: hypothetical protein COS95_01920 [Ignavibacteriales bacterium CG07_land_8_20_14_0_80_59_12]|nr:MAG: hypothetical protein COS95_01920 [Ignavibacteriales bacterium CG07_land_8_20_14_0_80_59_12]